MIKQSLLLLWVGGGLVGGRAGLEGGDCSSALAAMTGCHLVAKWGNAPNLTLGNSSIAGDLYFFNTLSLCKFLQALWTRWESPGLVPSEASWVCAHWSETLSPNLFCEQHDLSHTHAFIHPVIHPFIIHSFIQQIFAEQLGGIGHCGKEEVLPFLWRRQPFISQQLFTQSLLALCWRWWIITDETDWTALIEPTF